MIAYAKLIKDAKRFAKTDCLRDRYTVLAFRLERRWKRELRRRGKVVPYTPLSL